MTDRVAALVSDALERAEKIYRRAFPVRPGPEELTVTWLESAVIALSAELEGTKILLRQRAAIAMFLSRWDKKCGEEAAK